MFRLKVDVTPQTIGTQVTAEQIEQAVANRNSDNFNSVSDCIMSVALKSFLPDEEVICGTTSVWINKYEYLVDEQSSKKVIDFMGRKPIEPFYLQLRLKEAQQCSL